MTSKIGTKGWAGRTAAWTVTAPAAALAIVAGAWALLNALGAPVAYANEVENLIETLEVGEAVHFENLTVVPVYADRIVDPTPYTTLDEALADKWLEITEVEGGRVPQVKVTNRSDRCVYLMGGEILTGCRQDRLVGRDVLLGPRASDVVVPVYCVEHGRWTYESDAFYSKRNLGTSRLRAEGQKATVEAQANIWDEVSRLGNYLGGRSATDRYQAVYESEAAAPEIGRVEKRFEAVPVLYPDAVGVVIAVGGALTSADVFANPSVFARLWPKILRASALAAIGVDRHGSLTQADAAAFLASLDDRHYVRRSAIDLGSELASADPGVNVNALTYRGAVLHLAAFPEAPWESGDRDRDHERRIQVLRRR